MTPLRGELIVCAARGLGLAVFFALVFPVMVRVMASYSGWGATLSTSSWDIAFVALLGLAAAPLAGVERFAARRESSRARDAGWALVTLALACLAFVAAYLQITYAWSLNEGLTVQNTLGGVGSRASKIVAMWSESWVLLACYAPPFALVTYGRLRGWPLRAQIPLATIVTLLLYYASVIGFDEVPIVRWLAGSNTWSHPIVGTFVYLLPLGLGVLLPLFGWAGDTLLKRLRPPV